MLKKIIMCNSETLLILWQDLLYDAVKRHRKNGYLFIQYFLKCFIKFPVMTYCRRNAHLISPVRRITLNRHCISFENFVTVHGLLSSFRFESVGSPINCHAPIWHSVFQKFKLFVLQFFCYPHQHWFLILLV